jgi:hypothetical protein
MRRAREKKLPTKSAQILVFVGKNRACGGRDGRNYPRKALNSSFSWVKTAHAEGVTEEITHEKRSITRLSGNRKNFGLPEFSQQKLAGVQIGKIPACRNFLSRNLREQI